MKWIFLAASVVFAVQVQAATDAGVKVPKAAPKAPPKTKADAGVATGKTDAGVAALKTDAGAPPMADAGVAKASVDAGAAKEPAAVKGGAAYTLVAIPTPDKKIERLWKSKCGSCHGADGKAATEKGKKMKMSDLSVAAWQTAHGNDELKKSITEGIKQTKDGVEQEMDAYAPELTAEQIGELLTYVRWLGAPH
jgi:mono/diheme cytochrome c family protein